MPEAQQISVNQNYEEKFGWHVDAQYEHISKPGLSEEVVREISAIKKEPKWMLDFRLKALKIFFSKPMPTWGADLSTIDFDNITYYLRPDAKNANKWEDVPQDIKNTFDKLGIPEAERKFLAGAGAQFDSESVYHKLNEQLEKQGVIFCDTDTALKKHEDILREHFATVVPPMDNKFAALNSAVWSGGSFVYIPPHTTVEMPLQAYFRINAKNAGQFERTLIVVDKGAKCHYVEGCTAPSYSTDSLHTAVVEVIAKEDSNVRYTTIQNWSSNVYNLVTKRAHAHAGARVEWVDGNLGSRVTMKYPCVYLMGPRAEAEIVSVAWAGKGMNQDAGAKVFHFAPNTKSKILSRSISKDGGNSVFRGIVRVVKGASGSTSHMKCDALILDKESKSDTIPSLQIDEQDSQTGHEATCSRINEDQMFYLCSRGLAENAAQGMLVLGFAAPFTKKLPMEYAIELNRLLSLEMEGSVG
jgi:Fe-S cluster assembly protein SufB